MIYVRVKLLNINLEAILCSYNILEVLFDLPNTSMDPPALDAGVGVASECAVPDGFKHVHYRMVSYAVFEVKTVYLTFLRLIHLEHEVLSCPVSTGDKLLVKPDEVTLLVTFKGHNTIGTLVSFCTPVSQAQVLH